MDISAKFCPVCKNKNEPDADVCSHCGASLEYEFTDAAGITRNTEMQTPISEKIRKLPAEARPPERGIALYVENISRPVFLNSNDEFVIGRKVADTSGPIFDLSPLGGYHLGVSRRHAIIRRADRGYEIIDLGSSNGTWLNNERLVPHKPYPLASGSLLRIARLRIYVLYRSVLESRQKA